MKANIKDLNDTIEAIDFALELIGDPITVWSTASSAEIDRVKATFKMMRVAYLLLQRSTTRKPVTTYSGDLKDHLSVWTESQYEASGQTAGGCTDPTCFPCDCI